MGPGSSLAPHLAERFTVYTYDRRGRGASADTPPYAAEREIEDLDALIGEAGGSSCVFGHSSGAALALEAAARGSTITRLALYEAPYIVDNSRPPVPTDIVAQFDRLLERDRRGDAVRLFMRQVGAPRAMVAMMRFLPVWSKLEAVARTLPYDMTIMAGRQSGEPLDAGAWRAATMPMLVLVGAKSPAWFHNGMRALADVLPNARLAIAPRQTHMVKPKLLAPQLAAFYSPASGSTLVTNVRPDVGLPPIGLCPPSAGGFVRGASTPHGAGARAHADALRELHGPHAHRLQDGG
jgi:pimeloyl-ACP methyl ester carboxylesterase